MQKTFLFKDLFFQKVSKTQGMANCHAHLDRAYTLTPEIWEQASTLMEEKWILNRKIKENHTEETLIERISYCIEDFMKQGAIACRTHVDADNIVGMLVVESAAKVRERYKDRFTLQLVAHPLEGFIDPNTGEYDKQKVELYERACDICDVIGGLPSRDRHTKGGDRMHADFLFNIAKNTGKDIDVHMDQENNPDEKDTEWFVDRAIENGLQGRVTLVHTISVAAQMDEDRKRIYKKIADAGFNVTVCPKAAISMKQHKDKLAPLHNCIAQVDEMLEYGINVSLGTDNISDIFVPEDNGDLFEEILMLASACRLYDLDQLAAIATTNGLKTMKLTT